MPGSTLFLKGKRTDKAQFFTTHLIHDSCNQGQMSQGVTQGPPPFQSVVFHCELPTWAKQKEQKWRQQN